MASVQDTIPPLTERAEHVRCFWGRTKLQVAFVTEHIIDTIATYFKVSPEEVLGDRGEYRNIAIHLMKKWTSISNKQIGELFGALGYSAVSKV